MARRWPRPLLVRSFLVWPKSTSASKYLFGLATLEIGSVGNQTPVVCVGVLLDETRKLII